MEHLEARWVLASPGSLDPLFDGDGVKIDDYGFAKGDDELEAVAVQSDGKIVVAGLTKTAGGGARDVTVARYNTDGSRDMTFGTGGVTAIDFSAEDFAMDVAIDSAGRIVVVGEANDSGTQSFATIRLTSSGLIDTTFGGGDGIVTTRMFDGVTPRVSQARSVDFQSDGKIIVGGYISKESGNGNHDFVVARYTTSGVLDTTFGVGGVATTQFGATPTTNSSDEIFDIAVQNDDTIVAVGEVSQLGQTNFGVARYTAGGILDTTFDGDGMVTTDLNGNRDIAFDVQIEADGQIVVAGMSEVNSSLSDFGVARYNTDGSLDTSFFNPNAALEGLHTQLGTRRIRFPFASSGYAFASALEILPDGDYIVAGTIGTSVASSTNRFGLARVNPSGTIDTNFGFDSPPGGVDEHGYVQTTFTGTSVLRFQDVALQPDGMLVGVGWAQFTATNRNAIITRYDLDLGVPPVADAGGPYAINEPGGSIVLSGAGTTGTGPLVYEWDLDGDNNFGETGPAATRGDETGITPTFSATGLDGPSVIIVSLRVTNTSTMLNSTDTATINVLNVAPTADAGGPYQTFDDTPITLSGTGSDVAADLPLTFDWDLDFNGSFETSGASVVFDPVALGFTGTQTRTVQLRVTDGDLGEAIVTTTVDIFGQGATLVDGVLYVVGSSTANDTAIITSSGGNIQVLASFTGGNPIGFNDSSVNEFQVHLGDGHDIVVTSSSVTKPMTIDGGGGNDLLIGGGGRNVIMGSTGNDVVFGAGGDDVLLGGDGNDDLFGGSGNDVLVGGNGADILNGGADRDVLIGSEDEDLLIGGGGEDILIGGWTSHDDNIAALDEIMAIWGSTEPEDTFYARVDTLTGLGGLLEAGVAVFDDDDDDILIGSAGRDLVFGDTNPVDGAVDLIALQAAQDVLVAVI